MPMTQGDYGGGGSTTNVCPIGPQDEAAQIDSLSQRVTALETIVSQLLGVDVSTIQLSDFGTSDMGNILAGNLSGGILANLVTALGKSNIWATSAEDDLLPGQAAWTDRGMGSYDERTVNTVNGFSGKKSAIQYRFDSGLYNGGFYYEARVAMIPQLAINPGDANDVLPNARVFAGLGVDLFRSFAANNSDNPPTTYIMFSYSKPRGDATWKIMYNGKYPNEIATPDPATVIDTGMTIQTFRWYDLTMRCEAGSGTVAWSVTEVESKASTSGSFTTPVIFRNPTDLMGSGGTGSIFYPFVPGHIDFESATYEAGVGIFGCAASLMGIGIHHTFCQTLDVNTGG